MCLDGSGNSERSFTEKQESTKNYSGLHEQT
jgi:hypothetical protein